MPATANIFDDNIENWNREMDLPWARLKYRLVQANLAKHIGQRPLRVLDAGGGNGLDSIPLAARGHVVDILDYSQAMLADVPRRAERMNAQGNITTHCGDIMQAPRLFPHAQFDLILCHNVLQYLDDVAGLFTNLASLLMPDGLISVVSINRYSVPYHAAFLDNDLPEALAQIHLRKSRTRIFDAEITSYSAEELAGILRDAGLVIENDYGIRCFCDYWGDDERKSDPAIFGQIERLEFALTGLHPYKLLARNFQVIARKPGIA